MTTHVFTWSPLPPKKKFDFGCKQNDSVTTEQEIDENYFPNCEYQIWLRSCEKEVIKPLTGKMKGEIPKWLQGSLLRNGPGSIKAGKDEFQHLFDSSALIHKFAIKDGHVTYQCRFLRSDVYKKTWAANRIVVTDFGTRAIPDPCKTIFQKVSTLFSLNSDMSDNALVSLYPFSDEIYAFNEIPFIHRIDVETLETLNKVDVGTNVSIVNHTSHPHIMTDHSVYNIGLSMYMTGPRYQVIHFPKVGNEDNISTTMFDKAEIVASIPARWPLNPSYMHTFGITENYFIIVEQPLSISLPNVITTKFLNEPLAGALSWYNDQYTQINLISRKSGLLQYKFSAETLFYLHIINQYEDDDYVIIDICAYRDPAMIECMYLETMRNMHKNPNYAKMFRSRPIRFVLPLKPPSKDEIHNTNLIFYKNSTARGYYLDNGDILVQAEKLCDLGCETPRINYEKYLGKKYQYFYAISSDVDAPNPGTIIKVDVKNKTAKTWAETNCYPSEPIFVASPNATIEDDGIILTAMVWGSGLKEDGKQGQANQVGLLILNARNFKEIARVEFETETPVPKCLHGWFLPEEK